MTASKKGLSNIYMQYTDKFQSIKFRASIAHSFLMNVTGLDRPHMIKQIPKVQNDNNRKKMTQKVGTRACKHL